MLRALLVFLTAAVLPITAAPETPQAIAAEIIAPLIDPVKLATLKGDRPANQRLYKVIYWLETARRSGGKVSVVIDQAQTASGYAGKLGAQADARAVIAAHARLHVWRCYTAAGMEALRRGGSPTIELGPHAGEKVHVDHVLPVSVVPELRAKLYNLRPEPAAVNLAKGNKIGRGEMELARRWRREGLLSADGLAAVEAEFQP